MEILRRKKQEETLKDSWHKDKDEWQTLDDYLTILQTIRHSRQFETTFDPIRLRMYLILPAQDQRVETQFTLACRLYKKREYLKAAAVFERSAQQEPQLRYEAKFNQGTSLFKSGKFAESLIIFNNLLVDQQDTGRGGFKGLDRRLYYNVSVCHLQMGNYEQCVKSCNHYLKHVKDQHKKLDEISVDYEQLQRRVSRGPRVNKVDTQFTKVACHPKVALPG